MLVRPPVGLKAAIMASPQPPNDPPSGSSGLGGSSPGKAAATDGAAGPAGGGAQQLVDMFGTDAGPAAMILVLLLLEMVRQSFSPSCVC